MKNLLADALLDNSALKDLLEKNDGARREAASGRGRSRDERTASVLGHWLLQDDNAIRGGPAE